jgi:heat shock protein HslJ
MPSRSVLALLAALLLVSATAATGCSPAGSSLAGADWRLTAITETVPAFQGVVPEGDQSKYTITFDDAGAFQATADCNQVAGTYTTSGSNGLAIAVGPSTLAFCGDESMADRFVADLGLTTTWAIANDELTLGQPNGTMTFAQGVAAAP